MSTALDNIRNLVISSADITEDGGTLDDDVIKKIESFIDINIRLKEAIRKRTSGLIIKTSTEDKRVYGFIFGNTDIQNGTYVSAIKNMETLGDPSSINIIRTKSGIKYMVL